MIVTTLDPSLLGDIDMPYSNHLIPDRLMVAHGFKRLHARLTPSPPLQRRHHPARHVPTHGELAGLHQRRVRLNQPIPSLQVVDVRYQAGSQFGSGLEQRSQSDASVREIPWRRRWSR